LGFRARRDPQDRSVLKARKGRAGPGMSAGAATVSSDGAVLTVAGALAIEARACATGGATRASVGFRNISGQGAETFITNRDRRPTPAPGRMPAWTRLR
jgi:hypothetical protein